jgi:hypothetical protein
MTRQIIVFHEKHGPRYFAADTEEELQAACLKVVRERLAEEWYYTPEALDESVNLTDDQIASLPTASLQAAARADRDRYRRKARENAQMQKEWDLVQKAVDTGDGEAAYQLIRLRSRAEYEGFNIEALESSEPDASDDLDEE